VGGWIFGIIAGHDLMTGIDPISIIVAVGGALLLLVAYNAVTRPRTTSW
jgi:uncharacterized membrane protein YeaQ/YmgE (transglycosylase-associated protein family)